LPDSDPGRLAASIITALVLAMQAQTLTLLSRIDAAFGAVPRPAHFTNHRHCEECADHDGLLRARDRQTLSLADVGNPGWDPLCFITPEGLAYYFPTLARLALAEPDALYGWYADQFLFHLYWGYRDNALSALQRALPNQHCMELLSQGAIALVVEVNRIGLVGRRA